MGVRGPTAKGSQSVEVGSAAGLGRGRPDEQAGVDLEVWGVVQCIVIAATLDGTDDRAILDVDDVAVAHDSDHIDTRSALHRDPGLIANDTDAAVEYGTVCLPYRAGVTHQHQKTCECPHCSRTADPHR